MGRALFSATKKNQAAREAAKERAKKRPKIGTTQSHAARREAAKARQLERRRAPEDQAMPARNWPRVPKRPTPTSGPVFPAALPSSAYVTSQGEVRQWLQLRISWVERRGAVYWVVVPNCFYPWCKTEEDKAERIAAFKWTHGLVADKASDLPRDRQAVIAEGWEFDGETAVRAAREAIAELPAHVAALPIHLPSYPSIRAASARAALNALPRNQQRMPGVAGIEAEQRRKTERAETKAAAALKREARAVVGWTTPARPWPVSPAVSTAVASSDALPRKVYQSLDRALLSIPAAEVLRAFKEEGLGNPGRETLLEAVNTCLQSLGEPPAT